MFVAFSFGVDTENISIAQTLEQKEAQLRAELKKIEEEQAVLQKSLDAQKGQTATIERDVNILADQIKAAELKIRQKRLEISDLSSEISLRSETVNELENKKQRSKEILAELIRENHELDQVSLVEALFANDNLSDFFATLDSYTTIQKELEVLFDEIRDIIGLTEEEKAKLEAKQIAELDAQAIIESQKTVVATKKKDKDILLNNSIQTEQTYEQYIKERQQKAASIRAQLFQLRDAGGIEFGDAVKYAEAASRATGVRAAFILGILKQESDLGKNVGTCNRAGDPAEKKYTSIMPGPNDGHRSYRDDQTVFLRITKELGLDPNNTPLSCPWAGGWGGAMGPSQFIPTTWAAYESRIEASLGVAQANPWNPQHAVMATAIYVKDLGAAGGGFTAEKTAALKYYAGGNWNLPQNQFYGNSVMNHAAGIQTQIDFLNDVE